MAEKPAAKQPVKARPGRIRRIEQRPSLLSRIDTTVRELVTHPAFVGVLTTAVVLSLVLGASIILGRSVLGIAIDRISDRTHTVRAPFERIDSTRTERNREIAVASAPRVFVPETATIDALEMELRSLPQMVSEAGTFEEIPEEIRRAYGLEPEDLSLLADQVRNGSEIAATWSTAVTKLFKQFEETPLLASDERQDALATSARIIEIHIEPAKPGDQFRVAQVFPKNTLDLGTSDRNALRERLVAIAREAGFHGGRAAIVAERLLNLDRPLFSESRELTLKREQDAAAAITPEMIRYEPGQTIVRRGERITGQKLQELAAEQSAYIETMRAWAKFAYVMSAILIGVGIVVGVGMYLREYYPRTLTRPWRCATLAIMVAVGVAGGLWMSAGLPAAMWLGLTLPVTLSTMITTVAYDRRLALVIGASIAVTLGVALALSPAVVAALLAGVAVVSIRLDDIRTRGDVFSTSVLTGLTLVVASAIVSVLDRPIVDGIAREVIVDAIYAGTGGFASGAILLFMLPAVERIFDITTGMTLTELRDPKQPLLRLLQQRAPGTYNHSLNVATIAEAAADAIGADGLHLYVGALYHDVGKLNKPGYFVENQSKGQNKHNKLNPAMSVLVIIGHVKDGLELAREYNIPRSLHHYIESHHGTTLVEYFYDQAKKQADADDQIERPSELEYRYPGPRPRTREAAILMLCDAVESATRAMSEPTPARIRQLVHDMAAKRLMDGQFDESNLTLRELHQIEGALVKSLCSVYHGRIAYPSDNKQPPAKTNETRAESSKAVGA
ncbi:MAG: HD family phosphohydrolase [Phycisphaerales bacterium JB050]